MLWWLDEELKRWPHGENLAKVFKNEEAIQLRTLRLDRDSLIELAKQWSGGALSPLREKRLRHADAAFLEASRAHFVRSMATLHTLVETSEPYLTKFPKLEQYDEQLKTEEETNPHATLTRGRR